MVPIRLAGCAEVERKIPVILGEVDIGLSFEHTVHVDLGKVGATHGSDMIPPSRADGGGRMNLGGLGRGGRNQKPKDIASGDACFAQVEPFEIAGASVLAKDDVLITRG